MQQTANGVPLFGEAAPYGIISVVSMLAWGLGYFGVPQVLLRFMAIRHEDELTRSRRIATVWVLISLTIAVFIGVMGRALYPTALTTSADAENVFILLSTNLLPPLIAGFVMAGILAATISSSDSYLLIAASAFAKNIYQGLFRKKASDREVLNISRLTLLLIAIVAIIIALDENSVIFTIVSFAWAGFGATFGPLMPSVCSGRERQEPARSPECSAAREWYLSGTCLSVRWAASGISTNSFRHLSSPACAL